jgi:hypothetical protein
MLEARSEMSTLLVRLAETDIKVVLEAFETNRAISTSSGYVWPDSRLFLCGGERVGIFWF